MTAFDAVSVNEFCAANGLVATDIVLDVFNTLMSIGSMEDVIRCPMIHESNKMSALKCFRKAKHLRHECVWNTQGIVQPLLVRKETTIDVGHPFDPAPTKFLQFKVYADGRVTLLMQMSDAKDVFDN